jgi:pimeloyl-ACP methyl ester carboxylesterase
MMATRTSLCLDSPSIKSAATPIDWSGHDAGSSHIKRPGRQEDGVSRLHSLRHFVTGLVAPLLVGALPVSAADMPAGLSRHVVDEPVFHGQAEIYTAGPIDAPAVVLVHGLGDKAARDWYGLIPELARDHRVVTFDLPGFGHSTKENAPYTPDNYAAFVHYVVDRELGRRPIQLVGHSLGGAIALRYAALHPQDVSALVLVDVPGILYRTAYVQYLTRLRIDKLPNLYPAQNDQLGNLTSNVFRFFERLRPDPHAIVRSSRMRQDFLDGDPARIAGLALALQDFSADLPKVTAPTLLLWGQRDEVAPLRNAHALAAMLPHAQLEVLASSGHTPMDDVPREFNARVSRFLEAPRLSREDDVLRTAAPPSVGAPSGSCYRRRDSVFEGDYDRLVIAGCRDVVVRRANIRELRIVDSTASIEDSRIGGGDGGLSVDDARVRITSSLIQGKVAIVATGARIDLAGVKIVGAEAAVKAPSQSDLLFSISQVVSPQFSGYVHGLRSVTPGTPL